MYKVNLWSVSIGLLMAILFLQRQPSGIKSDKCSSSYPIAIIAVGLSTAFKRKGSLENVIIQSIGASSGVIVLVQFSLPALYILGLNAEFYKVFLSSLIGVFRYSFLIPFRKYCFRYTENFLSPKPPPQLRCLFRAKKVKPS